MSGKTPVVIPFILSRSKDHFFQQPVEAGAVGADFKPALLWIPARPRFLSGTLVSFHAQFHGEREPSRYNRVIVVPGS